MRPELSPRGKAFPFGATLRASSSTWPVMILFAIIIGGIYSGIFTTTEAAAVGFAGAFLFGLMRGHFRTLAELRGVFEEAVSTGLMLFATLFAAMIFAQFLNLTGMPAQLLSFVLASGFGPIGLVLLICVIRIALGTVFESIGILLLITPIFPPALGGLGINLAWFDILTVIVVELGLIIPPPGMNVFTLETMAPDSVRRHLPRRHALCHRDAGRGTSILVFPEIAT